MSWAAQRRTTIILLLGSLFFVLFVLPYILSHRVVPTCTDGIQNGEETGVDCGGSCALVCKDAVRDIKILWARIFPSRAGVYDVVAYVENPNFNIASTRVPYTMTLKDATGAMITTLSGETWIGPNERFAIFEGNVKTGDRVPESVIVTFPADIIWYSAPKREDIFSVAGKDMKDADKRPKLVASLISRYPQTLRNVDVTAIVYDRRGAPIAVSSTIVEKIAENGMAPLSFTWNAPLLYDATLEPCASPVDVVLAIDRSGSMRSDGTNPDEPLTSAKNAATSFIDRMTAEDQVAYLSFATNASYPLDQTLTPSLSKAKNAVKATHILPDGTQYTNIGDALFRAGQELSTLRHENGSKPVVVLLTDGDPTYPKDPADPKYPVTYARQRADDLKKNGVSIYTIGLGSDVHGDLLADLASAPDFYYPAASRKDLGEIYGAIATAICKKNPPVFEIIPRVNLYLLDELSRK